MYRIVGNRHAVLQSECRPLWTHFGCHFRASILGFPEPHRFKSCTFENFYREQSCTFQVKRQLCIPHRVMNPRLPGKTDCTSTNLAQIVNSEIKSGENSGFGSPSAQLSCTFARPAQIFNASTAADGRVPSGGCARSMALT